MTEQSPNVEIELARVDERLKILEKEPPRVRRLEQEVGVMRETFTAVQTDVKLVKAETHTIKEKVALSASKSDVDKIRIAVVKITTLAGGLVSIVGIIAGLSAIAKNLGWIG